MEVAIKKAVGKLPVTIPELPALKVQWLTNGYEILSLTDEQIANYQNVPFFEEHRDPFDRFLIGIAHYKRLAILTEDRKFRLYNGFIQLL